MQGERQTQWENIDVINKNSKFNLILTWKQTITVAMLYQTALDFFNSELSGPLI